MKAGDEFEVEKILKKRLNDAKVPEYLVSWKGYPDQTWETADTLCPNASQALSDFNNKKNPMNPPQKRKRVS